jgi:hypothetical protein
MIPFLSGLVLGVIVTANVCDTDDYEYQSTYTTENSYDWSEDIIGYTEL